MQSDILQYFGLSAAPEEPEQRRIDHDKENKDAGQMGVQSQWRKKGTQAIREKRRHQLKRASKFSEEEEQEEFDPTKHCVVCRAVAIGKTPPKRSHHEKCSKGRKKPRQVEELCAPQLVAFLPLTEHERCRPIKNQDQIDLFFRKRRPPVKRIVGGSMSKKSMEMAVMGAAEFRAVLDKRMEELGNQKKSASSLKSKAAPIAICEMVDYLLSRFPERFKSDSNEIPGTERATEAMTWYKKHIGKSASITFPEEGLEVAPSPYYNAIEGLTVYFIRWELISPGIGLGCTDPTCAGELIHDRWDFTKSRTLTPIYRLSGETSWVCSMIYQCKTCGKHVNGNNGELIHSLPLPMQKLYPVDPRYATGTFHFSRNFMDWFSMLSLTHANADIIAKSLVEKMGKAHELREASYYDLCRMTHALKPILPFPKLAEWIGHYPPEGRYLRDLRDEAARSSLTLCNVSDYERHMREIQSIKCDSSIAVDWTFDTAKNYPKKLGVKAVCNISVNTGEIASTVLVTTTAAKEIAHATESLARRPGFSPKVIYSDIWPKGEPFWKLIFGPDLVGRLGLFHFIKRISKTLRDTHCDYAIAFRKLLECIYQYNADDLANLIRELKAGNMTANGKQFSDSEIEEFRSTRKWKARYESRLKKEIYAGDLIVHNLRNWFVRYKVDHSPGEAPGQGRVDPVSGKKLFTPETKDAVNEQCENAKYLEDVLPASEIYSALPPSLRTKHHLPTYLSNRGESRLETFNGLQAHMGNSGMRESLADMHVLEGTSRVNVRIQEQVCRGRRSGVQVDEHDRRKPAWLRDVPANYNHSNLAAINRKAAAAGSEFVPHNNVRPLQLDNGERFMSEYFHEQQKRSSDIAPHPLNDRCQCKQCGRNPIPSPYELKMAVEKRGTVDQLDLDSGVTAEKTAGSMATIEEGDQKIWNPYAKRYVTVSKKRRRIEVHTQRIEVAVADDLEGNREIEDPVLLGAVSDASETVVTAIPTGVNETTLESALQSRQSDKRDKEEDTIQMRPLPPPVLLAPTLRLSATLTHPMLGLDRNHPMHLRPFLTQPDPPRQLAKPQREYCCIAFARYRCFHQGPGRPPHDSNCPRTTNKRQHNL